MTLRYAFSLFCIIFIATACSTKKSSYSENPQQFRSDFVGDIEKAHNKSGWDSKQALSADIKVVFGGNTRIDGKMIMMNDTSKIRIEQKNGDVMIWDGQSAWVSPASSEISRARFHLLTWPYFLAAPFKFSDPGTYIKNFGPSSIDGVTYDPTAKLTFGQNVGDAPDDWYILYKNPNTGVLDAMAYIVTYSKDQATAETDPHAIQYADYRAIDGVPISHDWSFRLYNHEQGVHGDSIGNVTLENAKFVNPDPSIFMKPADAREDKLPN